MHQKHQNHQFHQSAISSGMNGTAHTSDMNRMVHIAGQLKNEKQPHASPACPASSYAGDSFECASRKMRDEHTHLPMA